MLKTAVPLMATNNKLIKGRFWALQQISAFIQKSIGVPGFISANNTPELC